MKAKGKVVMLTSPDEKGEAKAAIVQEDKIAVAKLRLVEEGKPLVDGDYLCLRRRKDDPRVLDIRDTVTIGGPAMVNSSKYRDNFDRIFGGGEDEYVN